MSANLQRLGRVPGPRERDFIRNRLRSNEARLEGRLAVPADNRTRGNEAGANDSRRIRRWENTFLREDVKENRALIQKQIDRDRRMLQQANVSLTKRERGELERKVVAQREWLQQKMCPKSLFNVRRDSPDFARATQACLVEHTEEYKAVAGEYKQAMRLLDPDSESVGNIENIRPS
jgi:hypothetical protein